MTTNAFTIQEGMDVFGADGNKIGTVKEVFTNNSPTASREYTDPIGGSPGTAGDLAVEEVPIGGTTGEPMSSWSGTATQTQTQVDGYIMVDHGGFLGIGTKHLYIPFSAIDDISPGDCVSLSCSTDECNSLYAEVPGTQLDDNDMVDPL